MVSDLWRIKEEKEALLAEQAAAKPTYQERLMGESWETLSANDQYVIAREYPGETPPKRNPDILVSPLVY